jgi:DNA-binding winged helix-turn-helix (wHTH) protein/tetratricopeptide (TPR) repeat protein/TolB-like protein
VGAIAFRVVSGLLVFFWQNSCLSPATGVDVTEPGHPVYRFAEFELDPAEHRLLASGQPVTLTPKVFDTLVLLVERAGHVVSKDQLMAALWPRGFVHESNLTKHIWLIRKALGGDDQDTAYIETVPKLGYRFIAPVRCEDGAGIHAGPATATAPEMVQAPVREAEGAATVTAAAPPTPAVPARPWRTALWVVASLLAIAIALLQAHRWYGSNGGSLTATDGSVGNPDSTAVAIVDFNNLSQNPKDRWLGPALEQMLATEIAAGGTLHAVPDELVRSARVGLSAPVAGGYAPASLSMLRKRLGTHYVLGGAYFVTDSGTAPQLRVDLTLQDAASGKTLATLSRTGPVSELPQVVAQSGVALRKRLGLQAIETAELQRVANAQPPTAEVARRIGFALDALHGYDPARARDELLQAVAQAPGYAPAYAYLAQAWSALGYRAKALAAIGQAVANAQDLPQEQRLQIEAQQSTARSDWAQAIRIDRELTALRPLNPDYRLSLVGALVSAGKPDDANVAMAELRRLSSTAGDPRVELAAVQVAVARDDGKARLAHARIALQQAQARGEPGLIANAELQIGIASGDFTTSEPLLRKAAADYRKIGNPHGEALSYQNLANLLLDLNQAQAARETYQRAMAIYQQIGDLAGVAAIYDNLTRMLWASGDRDGAETAVRQALQIARETDDLPRQAWSLTGLATILSDESASDIVAQMYQQAIALDEQSGERAHHVFALTTYSDLLRQRGELDRARAMCTTAQAEARALGDAEQTTSADFECAQVALDRGEIDAAITSLASVLRQANAAHDTFDAANAQLVLGQIAMGQRRWNDARKQLQDALKGWTASEEIAGEAIAEGQLALCAAALGDVAERDRASKHAHALRGRITERQEVASLDIALAQLQDETGDHDAAIAKLRALAADADRRQWPGLALETRLAMLQLLERSRDPGSAALHDEIRDKARRLGYGWILARLEADRSKPAATSIR